MTVLDTHALLWMAEGSRELGPATRSMTDTALADESLAVSAITFWEIAMLRAKRRIELSQPVAAWRDRLLAMGLEEIPVDGSVGIAAVDLAKIHDDPADRLIIATAQRSGAVLVTADRRILGWGGATTLHDART